MRFVNSIFSAAAIVLLVSSCNSVDFKKTKGGMPYKLFPGKGTKKVEPGTIIKINYSQKLNDSLMFATYDKGPVYIPVNNESQPYDISEIIPTLKEGDSVYAVQMVDTFMVKNPGGLPPQFKKGDKLITTIKVLDVFKSQEEARADETKERQLAFKNNAKIQGQLQKDDKVISDYLSKNNINAQKVGSGTYVQIINQGSGPKIEDGKFVSLMYKGLTLGGKVFDTNMDTTFKHTEPLTMNIGAGRSIPGFEEGLKALSQGTKARLFIPSSLAYGEASPSPDIKANENLIFDIEVLEVHDNAPAPNMAPSPKNESTHR
ncbi:FKBP-type peptidyl-prolyl cis-trans isomerase [Chitinophagaceae bacterium LB-8]|uniref:Peptidyl-prolyl cis-trans isomerase n=1 Tax=Paraflavisolibacter caeni TaxID=2982496 RepID=A0A9X2Y1F7_9BACT|nr:FKBP-type peptidyl-prolyl cis-trans isomerase [Paraflavisolibacter caeni]MCU7551478.1 FKBP-type peptidyl-prolyl cis-trans isomerase [Paraflavisolibacter caeni]